MPVFTRGWRLRLALEHAGLTNQEMADYLGIARNTVSRLTRDVGAPPKIWIARQWAARCGVDFDWLWTGETAGTVTPLPSPKAAKGADREGDQLNRSYPWAA